MKKLKNNKKGFTLVEIIVVIVILAVLMAVAVPSVLSYINEANDAKLMAQARSVLTSAQAEVLKEQVSSTEVSLNDLKNNIVKNAEVDGFTVTALYDDATKITNGDVSKATAAVDDTFNPGTKNKLQAVVMEVGGKTITAVVNDKVYVK